MRTLLFQLNYSASILFITFAMTLGCTGSKDKERNLVPDRQAPKDIEKSIQVGTSPDKTQFSNKIVLLKENLGKAFMLIPVMTSTGRNPDETMLSPRIISFEKAGDRVALFNLSEPQLYDNMKSERLLQTFPIVEESDNSVVINLGQGFTSLDMNENMGVILRELMDELKKHLAKGNESSVEVKDSFVRKVMTQDNSIIIEQVIRIKTTALEEKTDPWEAANNSAAAKAKPALVTSENTSNFVFEIKPYHPNPSFRSKIYDKEQRIGFFLNFALEKQKDEPVPQITKWDISENRGPIQVHLSTTTPQAVRDSMAEGVLYWNKVFGREVLVIGKDFNKQDYQKDRSIHINWIPWDSAGFARAGFQADPITGEIIRGQVFMTSSWYNMSKEQFKILDNKESEEVSQHSHLSKCILDQKNFLDLESLAALKSKAWSEKATLDTVRIVLAHEIGHALGLRHNFAGSATSPASDSDMAQYRKAYIEGKSQEQQITSSTVMDYTVGVDTAINGQFIKTGVMPYDKAAISWGYLDKEIILEKYNYCSDEHIMIAASNQKRVFNCDRFDKNKNAVSAQVEEIIHQTKFKSFKVFTDLLRYLDQSQSAYIKGRSFDEVLEIISFSNWETSSINTYLYNKEYSETFVSIQSVIDVTLDSLNGSRVNTDYSMSSTLLKQSQEAGGYSAILKALMYLHEEDPHFYENQVMNFFKRIDPANFKAQLSVDQLEKIKAKMIMKAQTADQQYEDSLIRSFPFVKVVYEIDPTTNSYKAMERKINSSFYLGDLKVLLNVYLPIYQRSLAKNVRAYEANGTTLQLKTPDLLSPTMGDYARTVFSKSQYSLYFGNEDLMHEGIKQFKKAAIANSLELLAKMNSSAIIEDINSTTLQDALDKLDWTTIKGINRSDLDPELTELKKWENNP